MATLTSLPNMAKSFDKLKIILDLAKRADAGTSTGKAILLAIKNNTDKDEIIRWLKGIIADGNKRQLAYCISEELATRIENFQL